MKTLAAARVREYGRAVESLGDYGRTIELGLRVVMQNRAREISIAGPLHRRLGAVVFGSEQGLCGAFNERIASFAVDKMNELGIKPEDRAVVVIGERVAANLGEAGQDIERSFSYSQGYLGITQVILQVLTRIQEWDSKEKVDTIVLFHNEPESRASFRPGMKYLLPIDSEWLNGLAGRKWPGRTIPTFTMDWDELFFGLIRRHLFFLIYRAFVLSLASENTSRLVAMQTATRNIEDRLGELRVEYQNMRQTAITSELLDIVTSYEALTGRGEHSGSATFPGAP
jgi:F-type H+-transporting ATPase subunit gamma